MKTLSKPLSLLHTLCFCIKNKEILLLLRSKEPWLNRWNGLGGKIEQGESPTEAIIREMQEEAELDLPEELVSFAGIVTWEEKEKAEGVQRGTYLFSVDASKLQINWQELTKREGVVAWKPLAFALDKTNKHIATNLPYFLPTMLTGKLAQYHCVYAQNEQIGFEQYQLPEGLQPHKGH